jgi:hypothetical protein
MKKMGVFLILSVLLTGFDFAEKAASFAELNRPFLIHADETQLYIADGPNVFIYSLHDYNLVKQFGRRGEGPKEFKVNPNRSGGSVVTFLQSDHIFINSIGKVSKFSKNGEYIEEVPTGSVNSRFQPLGDKFVGEGSDRDGNTLYLTRDIYNSHFKKVKEIYKQKGFYQPQGDLNPFYLIGPITYVYDKKIYIISEMMEIYVFDESGEKLYSIKPEYEKLPITGDYKKNFHNWFKNFLPLREFYFGLKDRLEFPTYFPAIRFFHVVDNKVYILTYKKIGEKSEFLIYHPNGKFLKRIMVALVERDDFVFLYYPYTIKNNKLYQLVENLDEEEWELYVTEIK